VVIGAQSLAKELESTVEVHPHGVLGQPACLGNLPSRIAFDETKEEGLPIRLGKVVNRRDRFGRLERDIDRIAGGVSILELDFSRPPANLIGGPPARDRGNPAAERGGLAQRPDHRPCLQKDILREVCGRVIRHAREQDRVDEASKARVQLIERIPIAPLSRDDDRDVVGDGPVRRGSDQKGPLSVS
jgi:hypothetical protein